MWAKGLEKLDITEEQAAIIVKKELPLELIEPVTKDSQEKRKELKLSIEDKEKLSRLGKHDLPYLEFLELSKEVRFYECTKGNVNLKDIKEGNVENLTFDFKFGLDKIDEKIYLWTTAGQLLPQEVTEVSLPWSSYKRSWLLWEFFNESWKRLTIHQGTEIKITKLLWEENIVRLEEQNSKKVNTFLDTHSIYTKEKNQSKKVLLFQIADEAQKRDIDIDFAIKICMSSIDWMNANDNYAIAAKIEDVLTEFGRIRGIYKISWELNNKWKHNDRLALEMFSLYGWNRWKEKAKEYWIKDEKVNSNINLSKVDLKNSFGWKLSQVDFRWLKDKYPREASIKNNNPAWLTYNKTFAKTLMNHGINFYKGTARPSSEWLNYFWFKNMEDWMNAFNLLWSIKLKKGENKTFWDFAKRWAVDYAPYKRQFSNIWDKKIVTLSINEINIIKSKQMRIESPWMHKELKKIGVIS